MNQNKPYKYQILKFSLPAILMLAGTVGMVVSSFAWAPLSDIAYDKTTHDRVYQTAGEFQYSNAAVKGLTSALSKQLKGWSEWERIAYAVFQVQGNVGGVYASGYDENLNRNSISQYSYGSRNVFDSLVVAIANQNSGLEMCASIATRGNYSYDAFSQMIQCAEENGGANPTSYLSVYHKGLLRDAKTVLQFGESTMRNGLAWQLFWYEDTRQFQTMPMNEMLDKFENSIYASVYGNGRDGAMLYRLYLLNRRHSGDVDELGTMSESDRENFAVLYASAQAITSGFTLDLQPYIEKEDNSDDNNSSDDNNNTGDDDNNNSGDNTGDNDNDNTGDNNEPSDNTGSENPPMANPSTDAEQQPDVISNTNNINAAAPNTGALQQLQNSSASSTGFVLSMVATVAGLIGMIFVVKSYAFSPLKRK